MAAVKKVLLLTLNFPYYPGEQFLEEEISYWSLLFPGELIILPACANGTPRKLPTGIRADISLTKRVSRPLRYCLFFKPFFSLIFYREILYIIKQFSFRSPSCFLIAYRSTYALLCYLYKLNKYLKDDSSGITVYSYWFDIAAYAAALLKKNNRIHHVICRAHRFDVYENRRPYGYMPLKRQFIDLFDKILAISEEGRRYLNNAYEIDKNQICVARLGVEIGNQLNVPNDDDVLTIVSISYCVAVKRIDKIISAISALAAEERILKIVWHHLGDGPEMSRLCELAQRSLNRDNIRWKFHGELTNKEVYEFLHFTNIDVFINVSESEGIPVSIMEAMSLGIPAIAPDVGGVSELVNDDNGILLASEPRISSIVAALRRRQYFKNITIRNNAKRHIERYFNAKYNYKKLIAYVQDLL